MVHDHHHHPHHVQRDFISDAESWWSDVFGPGGDGGGQGGLHKPTDQPTDQPGVSIVTITAEPTTITGKPDKPQTTVPAGLGPPVQQTRAPETTHTTKDKETTTAEHTTRTRTSTSTSTTTTKTTSSTTHSTSTSSTSTSTTRDPQTTTFSTATAATTALTTTSSALTGVLDDSSTSTPSPSASAAASGSGGLSGGAKAGIAIGVLLGLAAIAGIVLFWLHKQKKRRQEEEVAEAAALDREKSIPPAATSQPARNYNSTPAAPTSPFGAHPTSQFNPAYGQPGSGAVGAGVGAGFAGAAVAGAAANASRGNQGPWSANSSSPPSRQDPFTDPENPFDGNARSSPPTPLAKDDPAQSSQVRDLTPSSTGSSPGVPSALTAGKPPTPPGEAAAAGVAAGVLGGAAVAAAAAAGKKSEGSRTPSPEYREGSPENGTGSRSQSPAMGGAPFASNVHRVQMDFTPSLADEMELHAGQLVRLLKAYDDGWVSSQFEFLSVLY